MEAFASVQGVRTTWSNEVARWEQEGIRLVLTAVVLEDSARKFQGVKVDLSSENARDQVYLDEQAMEGTRLALVEISDAIALTGMPGASGCMGAKEFWAGYDWPWNKYHELNVDFCGDSKNPVLVLHGRGKPGSFRFHGKSPTVLTEILATAMQKLKEQGHAQNEVAEACPVTKPPAQPFIPPPPYWIGHGRDPCFNFVQPALQRWRGAWRHLEPVFGAVAVGEITTSALNAYISARRAEGRTPATVNRELTLLKALFRFGTRQTPVMVDRVPAFPARLRESAPRQGFVTAEQYARLAANARELWLRALIACAYTFGFRIGELLGLRVNQVDIADRWITLEQGSTRNGEGRKVKMTGEVHQLLAALRRGPATA